MNGVNMDSDALRWWGSYTIPENERGCWQIGATRFSAENRGREWLLYWKQEEAFDSAEVQVDVPSRSETCHRQQAESQRFCFSQAQNAIHLTAKLGDRPVISHPTDKVALPPGQSTTLYIASPIWISVVIGDTRGIELDIPVVRPSDTWFGPMTVEGGFSYAAPTRAVTSIDEATISPVRAVTPVLVHNQADDMLVFERINLPVPLLSLYQAEDGRLWTQGVVMVRESVGGGSASLKIDKTPPVEAGKMTLISGPRREAGRSLVNQALGAVFG